VFWGVWSSMGTFKLILGLGVIIVLIYLGMQMVPVYYSNYEFQDVITREALDSTYKPITEDDIRDQVFKDAQQYDIPINEQDIKVSRSGNLGTGSVSISINYVVHINLPAYPFDLHFNCSSSNHGVY
jgi:predicted membrane protein